MPTGPRFLLPGACYHLITRGNQRKQVFFDDSDYRAYLTRLKRYKARHKISVYGFCLMPNHIHILAQPAEDKDLSKFMHGLSRSYTAYFNRRYGKVGYLWQGRFKSKVIAKDNYLVDCVQYIEHNPVMANIAKAAGEYNWSSYQERVLENLNNIRLIDMPYL